MNFYDKVTLVGHMNGYFYNDEILPAEICIVPVEHSEEKATCYTVDLSDVPFSMSDRTFNKYFSKKYFGLPFPPPKWKRSKNLKSIKFRLHNLHKILGGGVIGCVGERQRKGFRKFGLHCVNIISFVPPYEDLQHMPLYSRHEIHEKEDLVFCSINYAQRYATYLNEKFKKIKDDNSGMMSRLCRSWQIR